MAPGKKMGAALEPGAFSHLGSGDETLVLPPAFCWPFLEIQEKRGRREELLSPGSFPPWEAVTSLGVMMLLAPLCGRSVSAV